MDAKASGIFREFSIETIFSPSEREKASRVIWRSSPKVLNGIADPEHQEWIRLYSGSINIISSRDVRRNIRNSVRIALDLAAAGQRVLYINCYAGMETMRECIRAHVGRLEEDASSSCAELSMTEETAAKEAGTLGRLVADWKKNFRMIDCKMGMWAYCQNELVGAVSQLRKIRVTPRPELPGAWHYENIPEPIVDVVMINSYEYAATFYRHKLSVATSLMEWVNRMSIAAIVFTQEDHESLEAGEAVRGPLGLLTVMAASVAKTDIPKPEKRSRVHEQIPDTHIKLFYSVGGELHGVQYPAKHTGKRYPLSFWPRRITENIPDGIAASQVVGMPPMDD